MAGTSLPRLALLAWRMAGCDATSGARTQADGYMRETNRQQEGGGRHDSPDDRAACAANTSAIAARIRFAGMAPLFLGMIIIRAAPEAVFALVFVPVRGGVPVVRCVTLSASACSCLQERGSSRAGVVYRQRQGMTTHRQRLAEGGAAPKERSS